MNPDKGVGFHAYFTNHPSFRHWEGLFYQSGTAQQDFEREYTALRTTEGRLLPDAVVRTLPNVPRKHTLYREWMVRARSSRALAGYLKKAKPDRILEVGCGNGWLTNFLASQLRADCCGIDINEIELKQAVRVFSARERLTFVYGDIATKAFDDFKTDVIVCASVIQYFPDIRLLINLLKRLLHPGGEIHIVDSPLYRENDLAAAKARSAEHFSKLLRPEMLSYYHHHSWESLTNCRHTILHDPRSLMGRIKRWWGMSPFPWIVIQT
ncbi:MAG TPA: class I SAM-dependent methyltransferase [Cyclobacteriaceae bacterium]|nr:class I SAM-dependent methyltransferase [Cyclobacteriaceae bacterium]